MRYLFVFVVFAALLLIGLSPASAQTASEKAASLRAQLIDVETKQAELQTRLQNLDEKLKPENIESALAGVGSTHPEDLREQRRRQLEIERNGVQKQLELLNTSHSRLETAIAAADADAYRQSAAPPKGPSVDAGAPATSVESGQVATPPRRARRARKKKIKRSSRMLHSQALHKKSELKFPSAKGAGCESLGQRPRGCQRLFRALTVRNNVQPTSMLVGSLERHYFAPSAL